MSKESSESKTHNVVTSNGPLDLSLPSNNSGIKNTYVVLLKKSESNGAVKVVQQQGLAQSQTAPGLRKTSITCPSKTRPRTSLPGSDQLKLNLNLGFDKYDSSTSALNVFNDEEYDVDEGFHDKSKPGLQCTRIKIPRIKDLHVPPTDQARRSPCFTTGGQFLFRSPATNTAHQSTSFTSVTPASQFDISGSSGYNSANSSGFKGSYDTPSPLTFPSEHPTARQILHTPSPQPGYHSNCNHRNKSSDAMSSPGLRPSPVTSLTSNLKNVAVFQSPSSFNTPAQCGLTSMTSLQSASTPKSSGIVVQSASGHRFVLPTTPQQTKTVTVSKSDSHIEIQPIDFSKLLGKITIKKEIEGEEAAIPISNSHQIKPAVRLSDGPAPSYGIIGETTENGNDDENNSQESAASSQASEKDYSDALNDSLTNIQWLGGIQLKKEEDKADSGYTHMKKDTPIQWRCLSHAEVLKIAEEYGQAKRPPFSYMTLIQMALNSREDKRMTLREICKWIEQTFPYYKHTAKPGWKNSIRHNLSLYSIFEREKSKKHGSHWTIREDCPEKIKVVPVRDKKDGAGQVSSMFPVTFIPHQTPSLPRIALPQAASALPTVTSFPSQENRKRGLQPILPRPQLFSAPMQTYALIPIQNLPQGSSSQSQPMLIQVPMCSPLIRPTIKEEPGTTDAAGECDKIDVSERKKKVITIAPKISSPNIVQQAWLNAQAAVTDSDTDTASSKKIKTDEKNINSENKQSLDRLPKPKLYSKKTPPSKRSKARRKQRLIPKERDLMQDSSDEESDFSNKLQKDLPTPIKNLLDSAENTSKRGESIATSTPLKSLNISSSQLPSPIRGLTPLRNSNLLDNSFLDCLKDSDSDAKDIIGSPNLLSRKQLPVAQMQSPDGRSFDVLFSGLTPIKMEMEQDTSTNGYNHNLSKLLADFPSYSQMMDEDDGLPVSLNLSAMCQQFTSSDNG